MVGWQRHLRALLSQRPLTRMREPGISRSGCCKYSAPQLGEFHDFGTLMRSPKPPAFYNYLQQLGISSSTRLSSEEAPVSSPLGPAMIGAGKIHKAADKPSDVQAVRKGIKQSPKKVNLVAALVRGMRVEDALLQLQLTVKRAAKTVYQVIHSARANATNNHGLDADRLLVAEAFVGKGLYKKRLSYHGRGKCGIRHKPECRLTVVVRETTPEEEAKIAKLKVYNFRKLSKKERQLVPHKLIETTPIWNRKSKAKVSEERATI